MTPEQWEEAADYLDECVYCGKVHDMRKTSTTGVSWADPLDGHPYRRRASPEAASSLRRKAASLRSEVTT